MSRQIRQLEERLGLALFERLHRSVELTPAGERLHQAVAFGFDHVADAVAQVRQMHDERHVGVAANNAVAFYWLRPRVTAFQHEHPDIRLAVFAADADPARDSADIDIVAALATRHGRQPDRGPDSRRCNSRRSRPWVGLDFVSTARSVYSDPPQHLQKAVIDLGEPRRA